MNNKIGGNYGKYYLVSEAVDVLETVKEYLILGKTDIKYKKNTTPQPIKLVFLMDSTGSMKQEKQVALVKGLIQRTLARFKTKNVQASLIVLQNGTAEIRIPLGKVAEGFIDNIDSIRTSGKTNMIHGFRKVKEVLGNEKRKINKNTQLFVFTDGKINTGTSPEPFRDAVAFFTSNLSYLKEVTVVDTETAYIKVGQAKKLGEAIGAKVISIEEYN